jgi:hypothetical protein
MISLDSINQRDKQISENFQNMVLVIMGDWQRCPPVVRTGDMEEIVTASMMNSRYWNDFEVVHFTIKFLPQGLKRSPPLQLLLLQPSKSLFPIKRNILKCLTLLAQDESHHH